MYNLSTSPPKIFTFFQRPLTSLYPLAASRFEELLLFSKANANIHPLSFAPKAFLSFSYPFNIPFILWPISYFEELFALFLKKEKERLLFFEELSPSFFKSGCKAKAFLPLLPSFLLKIFKRI
jgi:hypothetical protein